MNQEKIDHCNTLVAQLLLTLNEVNKEELEFHTRNNLLALASKVRGVEEKIHKLNYRPSPTW